MSVTDLMKAARDGDLKGVKRNLNQVGKQDRNGGTALMYATRQGHSDCIPFLEREIGMQDEDGLTALMWAAYHGKTDCVRLLLSEAGKHTTGAWSNFSPGATALMMAAHENHPEIVQFLLPYEQGMIDSNGNTAMWYANKRTSWMSDNYQVRRLLENEGSERASPPPQGPAFLQVFATVGDVEGVQKHLDRVGYQNLNGTTALMMAAEKGHSDCIPLLEKEIGMQNNWGWTALMWGALNGQTDCARLLLSEAGRQSTEKWDDFPPGATALMIAVAKGHSRCIPLLEKEVRMQDNRGWTALMYAAHGGHIDCARLLLSEAGLQSSKEANGMPKGTSALMLAAARGSTGIVALLEPYELGLRDCQGNTAGHIARANPRNSKELIALLERDSPDNLALRFLPPAVDITPLIQAVIAGDREAFHAHLDEAGRKDTDGRTALMYAAERGEVEFVRLLRTQELRTQDQEGRIALMLAAQHGEVGCVKLLLEEADLENSRGESALDIAGSVGSKASHHTRCQCCALILRDDAGAGVGVGRHLSVAQRKLLTVREALSTAFSGDDAQHAENAFANIIAELNFLRQLTEQQDRNTNAAEIAALHRRLEERDAEVAAERQEHGRRIAELTTHLQERTDELEKRTLELQTSIRMPQPILTGDGYTLDELELLERNLTTSLKTITTSRAVLQSSSCIVCLRNPKDTLLQPCNHLCVCSDCSGQLKGQPCPLCRTPIDNTVKVHL
ncbi:Ankyrin repeat protein 2 [Giardia muris]|uniref:Ankyrin repeat protein 2 n=1 Tax=Giardia muris TaxID=5742 RepID=A0A4Z1SWR9_GIAMU|nr:Ankyrin repeat protein 2 [Giardia muris]|eukprot:TNJ26173.1 Ankyrin repeat protein 2 [Giardia muris]